LPEAEQRPQFSLFWTFRTLVDASLQCVAM
jgi:hypothetical protein